MTSPSESPSPPPAAAPPRRRRALLAGVAGLLLLAAGVGAGLALRRGPVDPAPLEAELQEARQMLGKSGRAEWAVRAARDASERLRWARAWNQALERGAPAEERERAWAEYRRHAAAAEESLDEAREELRLLGGERW